MLWFLYTISSTRVSVTVNRKQITVNKPFLAGNNAKPLVSATANKFACLPPLIITCVGHVQNVTMFEAETTAWQTTVPCWVIFEQGSVTQQKKIRHRLLVPLRENSSPFVALWASKGCQLSQHMTKDQYASGPGNRITVTQNSLFLP